MMGVIRAGPLMIAGLPVPSPSLSIRLRPFTLRSLGPWKGSLPNDPVAMSQVAASSRAEALRGLPWGLNSQASSRLWIELPYHIV